MTRVSNMVLTAQVMQAKLRIQWRLGFLRFKF